MSGICGCGRRGGNRDGDLFRLRIYRGHRSPDSALLPFQALSLAGARKVRLGHHDDGRGAYSFLVVGEAASHEDSVTRGDITDGDLRGGTQVRRARWYAQN